MLVRAWHAGGRLAAKHRAERQHTDRRVKVKKILQMIAGAVASIALMGGVAAADTVTCGSISNTGPGSTNTITCVDNEENSVSCNNHVVVENSNDQNASSGGAFTTNNTSAGDASSGDASNDNKVVVNIGASCAPVQTASTTPSGGRGGGEVAAASTAAPAGGAGGGGQGAGVAALPETGSSSLQTAAIAGLAVLAGGLVLSRLGLVAYRRISLK
jgi:LPXTG-motif cell wall-anchored protein